LQKSDGRARGGFYSVDSLNGLHLLVVDSDAGGREIVAAILRYCGALVTEVGSPAEALEVMEVVKANVLVVRVRPKGATMKVVRHVRTLKPEAGGVIPVVAVATAGSGVTEDQARAAGFDAFIAMPLDPWMLCRLISSLVSG